MSERWTPEELNKYEKVIKLAPKSRAREETRRKCKLNKLFNKLHGNCKPLLEAENKELKKMDELYTKCNTERIALQSALDKAKEALENKIIKCCRTCDSFDSKMLTSSIKRDGHCPFDSREHTFDDSCEKWNIEAFESEVKE